MMNRIPSLFRRAIVLALLTVMLGGCSAFYTREPVLYRQNVAIYRISAQEFPEEPVRGELGLVQSFPDWDADRIVDLLGNLEYRRMSAWGETRGRVFYEEEIRLIAPAIAEAAANLKEGYRLFIVSRYDVDRSVLSRMERNTALLWVDDEGLHAVFGEIRTQVPRNEFLIEDDWTDVPPLNMREAYPNLEIIPGEQYHLKKIRGYTHLTWAVIPRDNFDTVRFHPVKEEEEPKDVDGAATVVDENEGDARKDEPASPTERLRELKRAFDEGLINEEEYETRRKEILGDF